MHLAKPFDKQMKRLAQASPETLLQWLLPGAIYIKELPLTLKLTEFEVDLLLKIIWKEHEMLLHVEFQTDNDTAMAERTLRYHVLARIEHKLPVLSIVIYLFKGGNIPEPWLHWDAPTDDDVLDFRYRDLKLWELSAEQLECLGNRGLLALISLTENGAKRQAIQRMLITLYEKPEDADLLVIGYNLAMLALKRRQSADLEWLLKEFVYMQERFEDSPFYQMIEGRGLEKGLEEGVRKSLLKVVEAKYGASELPQLAQALTADLTDQDILLNLLMQISLTTLPEEARALLLASAQSAHAKH